MKHLLLTLTLISCSPPKKHPIKPELCTYRVWQIQKDSLVLIGNVKCD